MKRYTKRQIFFYLLLIFFPLVLSNELIGQQISIWTQYRRLHGLLNPAFVDPVQVFYGSPDQNVNIDLASRLSTRRGFGAKGPNAAAAHAVWDIVDSDAFAWRLGSAAIFEHSSPLLQRKLSFQFAGRKYLEKNNKFSFISVGVGIGGIQSQIVKDLNPYHLGDPNLVFDQRSDFNAELNAGLYAQFEILLNGRRNSDFLRPYFGFAHIGQFLFDKNDSNSIGQFHFQLTPQQLFSLGLVYNKRDDSGFELSSLIRTTQAVSPQWNLLLRHFRKFDDGVVFWLGGGITYDGSTPHLFNFEAGIKTGNLKISLGTDALLKQINTPFGSMLEFGVGYAL